MRQQGSSNFIVACGILGEIQIPYPGLEPNPGPGKHDVLATGLPGKFCKAFFKDKLREGIEGKWSAQGTTLWINP